MSKFNDEIKVAIFFLELDLEIHYAACSITLPPVKEKCFLSGGGGG